MLRTVPGACYFGDPREGMPDCARRRGGFTLIELLIVVTIIGMLAGIMMGALQKTRETARAARTKATIVKLNDIIMQKYESFRTRRVPVPTGLAPKNVALARGNRIRDLMRMEMPDRWNDVVHDPANPAIGSLPLFAELTRPAVSSKYFNAYLAAWNRAGADEPKKEAVMKWASPECLYMIVMSIPGAPEQFQQDEIGDVDNDGLPEFIDGWGHPIQFLRWPAGYINDPWSQEYADTDVQSGDPTTDVDPYAARTILVVAANKANTYSSANFSRGYALYPLIYSAGPDGEYDVHIGSNNDGTAFAYLRVDTSGAADPNGNIDPWQSDGRGRLIGSPVYAPLSGDAWSGGTDPARDPGKLRHYDNITNHRMDQR